MNNVSKPTVVNTDYLQLAFDFDTYYYDDGIYGIDFRLYWLSKTDSQLNQFHEYTICASSAYSLKALLSDNSPIPSRLRASFNNTFNKETNLVFEFFLKNTDYICAKANPLQDEIFLIEKRKISDYLTSLLSDFGLIYSDLAYHSDNTYSINFGCKKDYVLITQDGISAFDFEEFDEYLDGEDEYRALLFCLLEEKQKELERKIDQMHRQIDEMNGDSPGDQIFKSYS